MELKNFDNILSLMPKLERPMRVVLAGSDGENMLKGLFKAQADGFVEPVLVGDRARTLSMLERLGLDKRPYTLVETAPGHDVAQAAVGVIQAGDGDILMRGNISTHRFLVSVMAKENGLPRFCRLKKVFAE